MLIGITGKLGSGKSTAAEYLQTNHNFREYSMARPLKEIGCLFGFTQEQMYGTQEQKLEIHPYWGVSGRQFLQKVGTELFRNQLTKVLPEMKIKRTIWTELFKYKYHCDPSINYVVSDVRFKDEAETIRELGGIIIRTIRTNTVTSKTGEEHVHVSELEMDGVEADFIINNDELTLKQVNEFLDKIVRKTIR